MSSVLKKVAKRILSLVPIEGIRMWPSMLGRRRLLAAYYGALAVYPRRFVRKTRYGFLFSGSTTDVIQRAIYVFGVWEPDISAWVARNVESGDFVADIGANSGYFSLLAASQVGNAGKVISFEPVPSIHAQLTQNLAMNAANNVEVHAAVAGDRRGMTEIYLATPDNIGNSSTVSEPGFKLEGAVETVLADDLLAEDCGRLRLIKIDTEGDEVRVLSGLNRTLEGMASGGAVLVEVTPNKLSQRGHRAEQVFERFPRDDWAWYQVRNDYDFDDYDVEPAASPVELDAPPDSRADMLFVKR